MIFAPDLPLAQLSRVEDASLNASAPPEQRWLDGWLLRLSPGKAKRARCIQPLAEGLLPLEHKLELAARAFADAGLPLIARITPFSQPADIGQKLDARGWRRFDDTRVMVASLNPESPAASKALPAECRIQRLDATDFAAAVGALRDSPPSQIRAHAARLQASPVRYQAWALMADGESAPRCCGQIATEFDLIGIYDVFTAPAQRDQGLARALCTHMLQQAAAAGALSAYLQVDADNGAARSVYRRLGFRDAYGYHYRTSEAGSVD